MELRRVAVLASVFGGGCWFDIADVETDGSSPPTATSSAASSVSSAGQTSASSGTGAGGFGGGGAGAGGAGSGGGAAGGGGAGGAMPVGSFVDCMATLTYEGACFGDPDQAIYIYSDEAFDDGMCSNTVASNTCVIHLCASACDQDPLCDTSFACQDKTSFEICQDYPAGWSACFGNVAVRRVGASQCVFNDCTAAGGFCHEPAECWPFPP